MPQGCYAGCRSRWSQWRTRSGSAFVVILPARPGEADPALAVSAATGDRPSFSPQGFYVAAPRHHGPDGIAAREESAPGDAPAIASGGSAMPFGLERCPGSARFSARRTPHHGGVWALGNELSPQLTGATWVALSRS